MATKREIAEAWQAKLIEFGHNPSIRFFPTSSRVTRPFWYCSICCERRRVDLDDFPPVTIPQCDGGTG